MNTSPTYSGRACIFIDTPHKTRNKDKGVLPVNTILRPSPKQVNKYLDKWDTLKNYVLQENSLRKLFTQTYPRNVEMDEVLIKVCSLNDFYSTNIFYPFRVAEHIVNLGIDTRLSKPDFTLVNDITLVQLENGKTINFYSFATKYCSHHFPELYPIYDSYVEKMLKHFKRVDKFSNFKNSDLKDYHKYCEILRQFSAFYKLKNYTVKEIDKYLWSAGKESFPKNY